MHHAAIYCRIFPGTDSEGSARFASVMAHQRKGGMPAAGLEPASILVISIYTTPAHFYPVYASSRRPLLSLSFPPCRAGTVVSRLQALPVHPVGRDHWARRVQALPHLVIARTRSVRGNLFPCHCEALRAVAISCFHPVRPSDASVSRSSPRSQTSSSRCTRSADRPAQ